MPIACATAAKSGFTSSVPKLTMPAAFISSSTKFSDELLKTITLTGNRFWISVIEFAEHHCEAAVTGERDHLAVAECGLRADRVRQRARHGAVVERSDQSPAAVHLQVARRPDHRRSDVDGEDRVVGGEPIGKPGNVFRPDRAAVAIVDGQLVQRLAGPCDSAAASGRGGHADSSAAAAAAARQECPSRCRRVRDRSGCDGRGCGRGCRPE